MQRRMSFEEFLVYKGDEIDNAAYSLAVALLRTCPEQTPETVLAWDMSVIAPIVEAAQATLQRLEKRPAGLITRRQCPASKNVDVSPLRAAFTNFLALGWDRRRK